MSFKDSYMLRSESTGRPGFGAGTPVTEPLLRVEPPMKNTTRKFLTRQGATPYQNLPGAENPPANIPTQTEIRMSQGPVGDFNPVRDVMRSPSREAIISGQGRQPRGQRGQAGYAVGIGSNGLPVTSPVKASRSGSRQGGRPRTTKGGAKQRRGEPTFAMSFIESSRMPVPKMPSLLLAPPGQRPQAQQMGSSLPLLETHGGRAVAGMDAPDDASTMSVGSASGVTLGSQGSVLKKLTVNKVPQGNDYMRPYCSACNFEECEVCPWCFRNKLTSVHRVPIERVAQLILLLRPGLNPRQLVHMIARYARSDKYAAELNADFGWELSKAELCESHMTQYEGLSFERKELTDRATNAEEALRQAQDNQQAEAARYEAIIARLEKELEDEDIDDEQREDELKHQIRDNKRLKWKTSKMEDELKQLKAELEAAAKAAAERDELVAKLQAQVAQLEMVNNGLRTEKEEAAARASKAEDELAQERKQLELWCKGLLAGDAAAFGAARAELAAKHGPLQGLLSAVEEGFGNGGGEQASKSSAVIATQTEWGEGGGAGADGAGDAGGVGGADGADGADGGGKAEVASAQAPKKAVRSRVTFQSVKIPKKITLTCKSTLDEFCEVIEGKIIADIADESEGKKKDSMPAYMMDFFINKYGLRKIAMKKLGMFLGAVKKFAAENEMMAIFSILLGLDKVGLYCNSTTDAFLGVIRRLYAVREAPFDGTIDADELASIKGMAEVLDEENLVMPAARAKEVLLGANAVGGGVGPCTLLLSEADAEALVETSLPSMLTIVKGPQVRKGGEKATKQEVEGYPVEAFLRAVLDRLLEAVEFHQHKLREAFSVFDDEGNGLEYEEFQHLVAACVTTETMSEDTIIKAFEKVGDMYSGEEGGEAGAEADPDEFCSGVMRLGLPVSVPKCCHAYWTDKGAIEAVGESPLRTAGE